MARDQLISWLDSPAHDTRYARCFSSGPDAHCVARASTPVLCNSLRVAELRYPSHFCLCKQVTVHLRAHFGHPSQTMLLAAVVLSILLNARTATSHPVGASMLTASPIQSSPASKTTETATLTSPMVQTTKTDDVFPAASADGTAQEVNRAGKSDVVVHVTGVWQSPITAQDSSAHTAAATTADTSATEGQGDMTAPPAAVSQEALTKAEICLPCPQSAGWSRRASEVWAVWMGIQWILFVLALVANYKCTFLR